MCIQDVVVRTCGRGTSSTCCVVVVTDFSSLPSSSLCIGTCGCRVTNGGNQLALVGVGVGSRQQVRRDGSRTRCRRDTVVVSCVCSTSLEDCCCDADGGRATISIADVLLPVDFINGCTTWQSGAATKVVAVPWDVVVGTVVSVEVRVRAVVTVSIVDVTVSTVTARDLDG